MEGREGGRDGRRKGWEGGRDGRRKGWEGERYRKEGMGVDGKEERKSYQQYFLSPYTRERGRKEGRKEGKKNRQGKSEKETFLWRLLPPGLRRSVVDELSYQHYFLSPYTRERGRKEGMKEGKKDRQRKSEKEAFFMASPPSRLAPVGRRRT